MACMARNPDTFWILKPPNMNNGTGIQVHFYSLRKQRHFLYHFKYFWQITQSHIVENLGKESLRVIIKHKLMFQPYHNLFNHILYAETFLFIKAVVRRKVRRGWLQPIYSVFCTVHYRRNCYQHTILSGDTKWGSAADQYAHPSPEIPTQSLPHQRPQIRPEVLLICRFYSDFRQSYFLLFLDTTVKIKQLTSLCQLTLS